MSEGEMLRIAKAVEIAVKPQIETGGNPELKTFFNDQWGVLAEEEMDEGKVFLPEEWMSKRDAVRDWVAEDSSIRENGIKSVARLYQKSIQEPLSDSEKKRLEKRRKIRSKPDDFEQFVTVGFELIAKESGEEVISPVLAEPPKSKTKVEVDPAVSEDVNWEERWRKEWGDVPKLDNKELDDQLVVLLDFIDGSESGIFTGDIVREKAKSMKSDVFSMKSLEKSQKTSFSEMVDKVVGDSVKKESGKRSLPKTSEYAKARHGAIPTNIKGDAREVYKLIAVARKEPTYREAAKSRSVETIHLEGMHLNRLSNEVVKAIADGDSQRNIEINRLDYGDDYGALAVAIEKIDQKWDKSQERLLKEWGGLWGDLYDEGEFGRVPVGLDGDALSLYQQITILHQEPSTTGKIPQAEYQEIVMSQSAVSSMSSLYNAVRLSAAEGVDFSEVDQKWDEVWDGFNDVLGNPEGNKRRGIVPAFLYWAVDKKGLWGGSKKDLDKRIEKFMELNDSELETSGEFVEFQAWFRSWWIGEMSGTKDSNQNSFISAMSQISARLTIQGLENDVPIISIIDNMGTTEGEVWNSFIGETIGQLQASSANHNREILYRRGKNVAPEKVMEIMFGLSDQVAGRGESLGLDGQAWHTLLSIGELEAGKEIYGETFRKGLALYLVRDVEYFDGALTLNQLDEIGIKPSREMLDKIREMFRDKLKNNTFDFEKVDVLDEDGNKIGEDMIISENIFPLELGGKHTEVFVKAQRDAMRMILESKQTTKGAKEAERQAFSAIEVGFVGAELDYKKTSKEAMFKLMRTREYRYKYFLAQKAAGNPLSADDVERLALPFFDMIMLPTYDELGNQRFRKDGTAIERSFKDYILGRHDDGSSMLPSNEIPITEVRDGPDKFYYDGVMAWGVKFWGYIMNGTEIPWYALQKQGVEGHTIDEVHVTALQELYKYVGYLLSNMTVEQVVASFQAHEEGSAIEEWAFHTRMQEGHPDFDTHKKTEKEFFKLAGNQIFRRWVVRDVQQYGSDYNDAMKVWGNSLFETPHGTPISANDTHNMVSLLHHFFSKGGMVHQMFENDPDIEFEDVMLKGTALRMLKSAGILSGEATIKQLFTVAREAFTKMKLLEEHGRH